MKIMKKSWNHEKSRKSWENRKFSKKSKKSWKIMKNRKFSKSPKFFAFYLESSKNVLPLRNPLGSARPTQHWPYPCLQEFLQKVSFLKNNDTLAVEWCLNLRWRLKCWHVWLPCGLAVQSPGVADCTVLKSNISAFRKVLRHQNRFSSRRERSKNVKFDGFWTKSTLALQIRFISMISRSKLILRKVRVPH